MKINFIKIFFLLAVFFMLPSFASAANFPLEITNIKPASTGNPAIPTTNRIFRAYPGIEYNIRPAIVGGAYPFTFELSNAPAGMIINENTGEISWPNPQSNSGTITLTVTDSEDTVATTQWSITVSTSGFYFVDSNAPTNGTGTLASPFKTLANMKTGTVGQPTGIVYFRSGTYMPIANEQGDGGADRLYYSGSAFAWLGYPGEMANININHVYLYMDDGIYFDNLHFSNMNYHAVVMRQTFHYSTIRRSTFTDLNNTESVNYNQGMIAAKCYGLDGEQAYYFTIQDNDFSDFHGGQAIGSFYALSYTLIEDNYIHDGGDVASGTWSEAMGMKREMWDTYIRHNRVIYPANAMTIMDMYNSFYGRNMEISFNLFAHLDGTKEAIQMWFTPNSYYDRNTIVGRISSQTITNGAGGNSNNGATGGSAAYADLRVRSFTNNVIINPNTNYNDDEQYNTSNYFSFRSPECSNASICYDSLTDLNNLKATSMVGVLEGDYELVNRSYVGTYGWELPSGSSDTTPPASPAGLSVM